MEAMWKRDMRKHMLDKRNKMDDKEVSRLSSMILSTLSKLSEFKKSKNVMLYLSFNKEVDSYELIKYCQEHDKNVIIPFCKKEGVQIIPTELKDVKKELVMAKFGYMEPKPEYLRPVNIKDIDIIIIPGIAFDKRCYRIGYGAGYYDRFLAKTKGEIPTVGLAYDFQLVDRAQVEEFDIPLDYVITEKRIIVR